VPLISLDGAAVTVDGLRVGDLESSGRVSRVSALFVALRARREAWLGVHAGEPWPGVVAYRFPPDTPAFAVKSVVLTAGYAACPNGSLLVEVRGEGRRRVGRLPVDPLMVSEPDAQVLTVEVKREAVVVAWKAPGAAGHLRVLPRAAGSEVLEEADLAALESEVDAVWSSRGAHRSPADPSFDQVVLHVEDALPYRSFIAVIDALHGPQRSLLVGRREERVPALNVNLAPD
jgi:hypothetical protein